MLQDPRAFRPHLAGRDLFRPKSALLRRSCGHQVCRPRSALPAHAGIIFRRNWPPCTTSPSRATVMSCASSTRSGDARAGLIHHDGPRRYPPMIVRRPSGFIEPCLPSKVTRPPSGPLWVHEIKHDGYRLMVRRDGSRVRCFTRNGHDWADSFPAIVEAAARLKAQSFLIDGEAGGRPRRGHAGFPCAAEQTPWP